PGKFSPMRPISGEFFLAPSGSAPPTYIGGSDTPAGAPNVRADAMKAIVITRPGGPEVLEEQERPMPEPGPSEIRVRVRASALNRADLMQRRGAYPPPPGAPRDVPGLEYAGEVDAVGPGSGLWAVGNRVMGIVGGG